MKSIQSLSSIVLVGILNAAPCLALSQPPSQSSSSRATAIDLNYPNNSTNLETNVKGKVLISDILRTLERERNRQDRLKRQEEAAAERERNRQDRLKRQEDAAAVREQNRQDRLKREEDAAAERKEIRDLAAKRQEQLDLARKEASERERIEAERRYKYFMSLSPAGKERYITQQRILQDRQNDRSAKIVGLMMEAFISR